jgi:hypothetical protein|tara:strand:- start:865 stop:1275 length:411 start_codon:yes stop_codon:yes gene_type:complete
MKIVSDKPLRIATLFGACVLFEPGVALEVSSEIGLLALQEGAAEVKEETVVKEQPPFQDSTVIQEDISITLEPQKEEQVDRFESIVKVLRSIIEEGNPDSFKTDGTPKATVVNKVFGSAVLTDEREAAWQEALNSR